MTDRELLELAAKASGELTESWYGNKNYIDGILDRWNPLTDDGDALRLAVKLNLIVGAYGTYASVGETYDKPKLTTDGKEFMCWHHEVSDPCAATRLAITRAAAEIGKEQA